jgi:UDP-N-acetylmuramoyl-tripeptide--D-alanyl-D-alanine ligase
LRCKNIEDALLAAAKKWREKCGALVVAVTGSAGKTTTKEAIAAVLGGAPHNAGNYNSGIGMPLCVLSFPKSEFWVCELGINHVGEMEKMSASLHPDVGVITNVGSAHIGHFGDPATVLKEKLKLCRGMDDAGMLVLPTSLKNAALSVPFRRVFSVGADKKADFSLENITMDARGVRCDLRFRNVEITNLVWPVPGVVGSSVLGLAGAIGVLCGRTSAQIRAGLETAARAPLHTALYPVGRMLFLEDCYNASPEACVAALESLYYLAPGRTRVAVLGDMLELGEHASFLHRTVGAAAHRSGVSYLFTYGALALQIAKGAAEAGMPAMHIFSFAEGERTPLAQSILSHVPSDAAVLFKGSRALRMEQVIEELRRGT